MKKFKKPTNKQLVEIAIIFNNGVIQPNKISDMVAMSSLIIDRLHEHGDVTMKSTKELRDIFNNVMTQK